MGLIRGNPVLQGLLCTLAHFTESSFSFQQILCAHCFIVFSLAAVGNDINGPLKNWRSSIEESPSTGVRYPKKVLYMDFKTLCTKHSPP
jgi:hypothetical protein